MGVQCLEFTNTNDIVAVNGLDVDLIVGETYTFSFYAKGSDPIKLKNIYINASNRGYLANIDINTKWKRYSTTFTVANTGTGVRVHLYPVIKNSDDTYKSFYLANWKLEKGNSATDWSPATKDESYETYGHHNRYLAFDGVDDKVIVDKLSENLKQEYTFEISMTIPDISKLSHTHVFVGKGSWNTNNTSGVALGYNKTHGRIQFVDRNSWSTGASLIGSRVPEGTPFLLHGISDSSGGSMYVNGEIVDTSKYSKGATIVDSIGIGHGVSYGQLSPYNVHSVKVYNRPLTSVEIQDSYEMEKARWKL